MEYITNPWVISLIIVVFIIGNLASMKHLGQTHLARKNPNKKTELEKLIAIYKEKDAQEQKTSTSQPNKENPSQKSDD
ncbi:MULTISPECIES: DUF2897 domain-containing protein [Vibrio]|uniref:DUF2897 domain-containing protein n=1 Tax=Vibrio algicola TaxID=2662262 RepID=A0A5Q0TER9_9VIBR|nr:MULTISPECIES: DUF2897 domain-containing protein [Vibrio]MBD1575899.1 DUF2897 domain-containing protein [Vibrio sp. S11_S32]